MQLVFYMEENIKFFYKLILLFLNGVASMLRITKITSLQYVTNDMLDYFGFSYVHRPPNNESNPLRKCQSKIIANVNLIAQRFHKVCVFCTAVSSFFQNFYIRVFHFFVCGLEFIISRN